MALISQKRILEFFKESQDAENTTTKGRALESLICYVFEKIPGITVTARNANNYFHSEEIDIVFWNDQLRNSLTFLPNLLFVECKNWERSVGSTQIRDFESKLRGKGLSFGIIVATNGISGNEVDRNEAHHVIDRALAESRQIIVITREEIENLSNSLELILLIKKKLCQLYVSVNVL